MSGRFILKSILCIAVLLSQSVSSLANDIEAWHDPSFRLGELKKIFILPVEADLKAGQTLIPERQLNKQMVNWVIEGIRAGRKQRSTLVIKDTDSLIEDMKFIYTELSPTSSIFFQQAAEMGYEALVRTSVWQEFVTEHIPEEIRTYTVYREIERKDYYGRVIETIKVPEEKTEIIPAHDVTYLQTMCQPVIYSVNDYDGDYKAIVNYRIYREYQGGNVVPVIENIIKASMKELMNQPDSKASPSKTPVRSRSASMFDSKK